MSATGTSTDQRQVLAAVDLGSNSFHMIVARYEHGQLIVIDRLREMVRLAAGLDSDGITEQASTRALECLGRFGQRLRNIKAANVRAVGTNALRKARNAEQFLRDAEQQLGHPIEVVSGREEARLVYLGAASSLPEAEGQRLVIDIGGGSTELIIGDKLDPLERFSLYMGCVGLTEKFFPGGKVTAKRWRRAHLAAQMELEPVTEPLRALGWRQVIGTSGTIRTVQAVVRAQSWCEESVTPQGIQRLKEHLLNHGSASADALDGLSAERAPVFVGGVVILAAVVEALAVEELRAARGALREGLIFDMIGRLGNEDARDRSVTALESRYRVDAAQARRVEQTAMTLLGQVSKSWKLKDQLSHDLLSWAARLHEMGVGIAHSRYNKHGAYLIANSDLAGFSNREKQLLSTLVLSHRRKLRVAAFQDLPSPWNKRLLQLAVLLRLSVVLHRSRAAATLPPLRLKATKRELQLRVPEAWLESHPLTEADLDREKDCLRDAGYQLEVVAKT